MEEPFLQVEASASVQPLVMKRAACLMSGIMVVSLAAFGAAALCAAQFPIILGHSMLAFALGLRHAVDVDHLAAIDNVTRQLISRGQFPVSVGFWFALGHSVVVYLLSMGVAGGYSLLWKSGEGKHITGIVALIAAVISVSLLAGIGILNARVAFLLFRDWCNLREQDKEVQDETLENKGQASLRTALSVLPLMRRVFDRVDRPHKMFWVGLLFGLSFDTATQVGVIGLAAMSGTSGRLPPLMVMIFPLCFSCGMCLVDTSNGLLMLVTYSWATVAPIQKLFYNFLVTAISACVAISIGSLELLQLVSTQAGWAGPFWKRINSVDIGVLGYMVIGTFALVFGSAACYSYIQSNGINLCTLKGRVAPS